jgi:hypothetical protein
MKTMTVILMVVAMVIGTASALCAAEQSRGDLQPGVAVDAKVVPDTVLATMRGKGEPLVGHGVSALGFPALLAAFRHAPASHPRLVVQVRRAFARGNIFNPQFALFGSR